MAALLDTVGTSKAIVAGLSLGGYMSLAFAATHPERVRALMLFDTGPGFKKDEAREKWNATAQQRADRFEAEGLAALNASDEVKLTRHRDASGLARAARGMLAQQNDRVIQSLGRIAVPTLVLVGADDTNFLAATDYMAAKIKGATKVVDPRRRPCGQPASAGAVQPGGRGVPRLAAARLRERNMGKRIAVVGIGALGGYVGG